MGRPLSAQQLAGKLPWTLCTWRQHSGVYRQGSTCNRCPTLLPLQRLHTSQEAVVLKNVVDDVLDLTRSLVSFSVGWPCGAPGAAKC